MKFENQIRCQYCGATLGVEERSDTDRKVAMLILHRGVCRNRESWPHGTDKMPVPELKAYLIALIDSAVSR